ncbi:MAG: T9SS type A sorting domain-containing protein [Calditrichae bacterium]|nr:T9SS type A sorting domain-containing protein [Calditrichota bacterium]MCB9058159.1 T9SS type A sorting domain-containing protein [Calditrichia bacterium]
MKKIIHFLSVLFLVTNLSANDKPTIEVTNQNNPNPITQMESIFSKLDKTKIKTGILYNKIIWYEDIDQYDGTKSFKTAGYKSWRQLYYQIYRAHIDRSTMPNLDNLDKQLKNYDKRHIPIAILFYEYQKFREDAFESNMLKLQNDKIVETSPDVLPYQDKQVFAVSALRKQSWTKEINFVLDKNFSFSNKKNIPQFYEIDFGDGNGYRPLRLNESVKIRYADSGEKTVKVKTYYQNQLLTAYFSISVMEFDESIQPDIWWEHEVAAYDYDSIPAEYDAYVFFGKQHNEIVKPIIFAEGFDFDDELRWQELYELLDRENFISTLRGEGYDVIILNWRNPTDYIQRNSLALITLIERVLSLKQGKEPILLGGASMGGLVGRYALALMEQQGKNHQSRLFISFDSPQNGANIPLGVQHWVKFFADYDATAKMFLRALNSPGAQQMLAYHHLSFPEKNQLQIELEQDLQALNNYPSRKRMTKLAVSNGSGAGANGLQLGYSEVPMQPGDKIISWKRRNFLVDVDGDVWAVPNLNPRTRIFEGRVDILGPDYDAHQSYVEGTLPYDNAPGGWRSTQEQIAAVNPRTEILGATVSLGNISTNFPRHAFIPTISALDLRDENGYPLSLMTDISADSNLADKSPFDDIYFAQSTVNEEHVDITPGNSQFLLKYIEQQDTVLFLNSYTINWDEPVFRAVDSIITGSNFYIGNEGSVEFDAGDKITLKPGFHSALGSDFHAHVKISAVELRKDFLSLNKENTEEEKNSINFNQDQKPEIFDLLPNYPNPFNPLTTVTLKIAKTGHVRLSVYDTNGRCVAVLREENFNPGIYNIKWDASSLASGIYYIHMLAGNQSFVQKSIVLK